MKNTVTMGLLTFLVAATTTSPRTRSISGRRLFFSSIVPTMSAVDGFMTTSDTARRSRLRQREFTTSGSSRSFGGGKSVSKFATPTNPTRLSASSYNNDESTSMMVEGMMSYEEDADGGYSRPGVQWYPGHIAKAERQLSETLKAVDVVVEVRDARAAKATSHPKVGEWCAGRPRIVVLTHLDMIPRPAANAWRKAYETLGAERWDEFTSSSTTQNKEGYNVLSNPQIVNQAKQARQWRFQYDSDSGLSRTGRKKTTSNDESTAKKLSNKSQSNNNASIITPVDQVLFVNAKQGEGIHALHRAIFKAGAHVQERRQRRGLNPRALRVGIIGYPNVGKSALINKILGRRRAKTANIPGVTRSLQWIRVRRADETTASGSSTSGGGSSDNSIKKEFELLDSPGIIPAKLVDQSDALLLAACNCIGQAAYDNQAVAAYLCEWLKGVHILNKQHIAAPQWRRKCKERYGFDPMEPVVNEDDNLPADSVQYMTGEDMLFKVADNTCRGDPEDASRKILQDFRTGRMGPISLQLAPESTVDEGQLMVPVGGVYGNQDSFDKLRQEQRQEGQRQVQLERARIALETAKERGLELPPVLTETRSSSEQQNSDDNNDKSSQRSLADTGKGMFDGW